MSEQVLTEAMRQALINPGCHLCKLYCTDGITQSGLICQLYANFYRRGCYQFSVHSACPSLLVQLNQLLGSQQSDCLAHLAQHHQLRYADTSAVLDVEPCIVPGCPFGLLKTIKQELLQHGEGLRTRLNESGDAEAKVEVLREDYAKYCELIVCLDAQLPALGLILNSLQVNGYPYSVWKLLHEGYGQLVLRPRIDLIITRTLQLLNNVRAATLNYYLTNDEKKLEEELNSFPLSMLHAYVTMIAELDMNEVLVHSMEDSRVMLGPIYTHMLGLLQEQTQKYYAELSMKLAALETFSEALNHDIALMTRFLLPQAHALCRKEAEAEFAKHCEAQGLPIQPLPDGPMDSDIHVHDIEVQLYMRSLGIPRSS
jgi:hypothetical protein